MDYKNFVALMWKLAENVNKISQDLLSNNLLETFHISTNFNWETIASKYTGSLEPEGHGGGFRVIGLSQII